VWVPLQWPLVQSGGLLQTAPLGWARRQTPATQLLLTQKRSDWQNSPVALPGLHVPVASQACVGWHPSEVPTKTWVHVPTQCCPTSQAWQGSAQAVLQQTPSTQWVLWHSPSPVQCSPSGVAPPALELVEALALVEEEEPALVEEAPALVEEEVALVEVELAVPAPVEAALDVSAPVEAALEVAAVVDEVPAVVDDVPPTEAVAPVVAGPAGDEAPAPLPLGASPP
jgi:hypothetical protein